MPDESIDPRWNMDVDIVKAYDEWFYSGGLVFVPESLVSIGITTETRNLSFPEWTKQRYPDVYQKIVEYNNAKR